MVANHEEQKKVKKKKEQEGLDLMIAYRQTFSTKFGEKVLADLQKRYNLRSSFHDNPTRLAFNEGERNVVLMIMSLLSIDENQIQERVQNVSKPV